MTEADFPVTIYHNPACGTSRNTVAMVRASGYDPRVIDYIQMGWTEALLTGLAARAGLTVRALLREKEPLSEKLGLLADGVSEDRVLDAMLAHPILVNRPIVATPKGIKLCRPSEVVFDLLERRPATFVKEDGDIIG